VQSARVNFVARTSTTQPTVHNLGLNIMRLWTMIHNRRNWVHLGSPQAGPKVAAILSVVETCRRLRIPIREYLASILPGLADVCIRKMPELTPAAWAARQA